MKNTITIETDNNSRDNAKILSVKIQNEEARKRSYILSTGAFVLTKYLKAEGYNVSCKQSLFKIPSFAENLEIADIYLGNARIDVRVTFDEKKFYIPKSHKKYSVLPDFYIIMSSNSSLTEMKILGFITNAELNEEVSAGEYYEYATKILKPLKSFEKAINCVQLKDESFSQNEHKKISELAVSFFDNEISDSEKIFFIKHLLACTICRERICEFSEFDTIIAQAKNYPELFDDQTLNILAGIENKENAAPDFLESEISPSVLDMVKDTTAAAVESTAASAAGAEGTLDDLSDLTDFADETDETESNNQNYTDEESGGEIPEASEEFENTNIENVQQEDTQTEDISLTEDTTVETSEIDTLSELEDEQNIELLPSEDSLENISEGTEENSQENDTDKQDNDDNEEVLLVEESEPAEETDSLEEIESEAADEIHSLEELESEPIIDIDSEEDAEKTDENDEVTDEANTEITNENSQAADEEIQTHTSLDDLESEIVESATEPFAEIEEDNSDDEALLPVEENEELSELEETGSEAQPEGIEEGIELQSEETEDEDSFSEISDLELDNTADDTLLEAEDEPLELNDDENDSEMPESEEKEEELNGFTAKIDDIDTLELTEEENILPEEKAPEDSEEIFSENNADNIEDISENFETNNEIFDIKSEEKTEILQEEAEEETPQEIAEEPLQTREEADIPETETAATAGIEENQSGLYADQNEVSKIDQIAEPQEEEEVEYSGIELIDDDDLPSEIPEINEQNSQINEEIQDLLDEELMNLLSEDDTVSETPIASQETNNKPVEENDDSIGTLFENDEPHIDEKGETTLDLSDEPATKSAASLTKKIITAAILLLLIAAGGVTALYLKFNKSNDSQLPDMNAPQDNSPLDEAANQAGGPAENEPPMAQDINKSMTNVFSEQPAAITITKISWEVSQKLATDETFKNYLQIAGKNLQLNLQNDLAYTTDFNYNNNIKISFEIGKDNAIKRIQVTESSGSEQIDNVVLQSIKETLKYINVPNIKGHEGNYNLSIVINF